MTRSIRSVFLLVALAAPLVGAGSLRAQSSNLQFQVANLVEDFRLLDERMRQMTSDMEELRRENARLREQVSEHQSRARSQAADYATVSQVNELVRKAVAALESRDEVVRREVVANVAQQLEAFGKRVNEALGSVNTTARPDPNVKTTFDTSGVPQSGTPYTVQPGDSIASIAKKFDSRIDWIQNINKISDPRLLQVGQVIFVPQASQ